MLKNIKSNKKGFTIVELLIVIVVIAILAAISIVAYNGIQNRGKTSSAASAANTVIKKAEAANAAGTTAGYPVATSGFAAANAQEAEMAGSGITLGAITAGTQPGKPATVEYLPCTSPSGAGATVSYYDYTGAGATTKVTKIIGAACTTSGAALSQAY